MINGSRPDIKRAYMYVFRGLDAHNANLENQKPTKISNSNGLTTNRVMIADFRIRLHFL